MTLSNIKGSLGQVRYRKIYSLDDASKIVKDISKHKFDSTVDLAIKLGVDRKAVKWLGERFFTAWHWKRCKSFSFVYP